MEVLDAGVNVVEPAGTRLVLDAIQSPGKMDGVESLTWQRARLTSHTYVCMMIPLGVTIAGWY